MYFPNTPITHPNLTTINTRTTSQADNQQPKKNNKRIRLVEAADELFYKQGIHSTTLANIASCADVPLGNVYYYFKSKDLIILAVRDYRKKQLAQALRELEISPSHTSHKDRLVGLVKKTFEHPQQTAQFGDRLGSLCYELSKQQETTHQVLDTAKELMQELVNWSTAQFQAAGHSAEKSNQLACYLIATLQGMSLLSLAFRDQNFLNQQINFLIDWIGQVI